VKARTYLNLGKLQLQIGDLEPAFESFKQGLNLFKELDVLTSQIETLNLMGETHRRLGNYDRALETLNKVLDLAENLPKLPHKSDTYFYFARVYKDLNRIELAEDYLQKSIVAVKQVASNLVNHEQRYNFSQKIQPLFEEMVLLQYAKNDPKAAFFYAEEERAHVLKILMQDNFDEQPDQVTVKAELNEPLARSSNEYDQLILNLQNSLDDRNVLVEYEVTDSSIVTWVVSCESFHAEKVQVDRKELEQLISEFRACTNHDSLETSRQIKRSFSKTVSLGKRFYEYLIEPIENYLSDGELVYFIPDEALNYLPFAAIATSDSTYLIEDFAIAVVQSAEILRKLLQRKNLKNPDLQTAKNYWLLQQMTF